MKNFASRIALLAVVGSLGMAAAPAWAQNGPRVDCRDPANAQNAACMHKGGHGAPGGMHPQNGAANGNGPATQPTPPANPKPPTNNAPGAFFNNSGKANPTPPRGLPPAVDDNNDNRNFGNRDNNNDNRNFGNRNNNNDDDNGNGPGRRHGGPGAGPGGPGFGHMPRGDMGRFRDDFRRFHFSPFARPDFAVRPGIVVPRYYHLRPLPPEIFRDYPYYRGYLFFVAPNGDIVIVSPRSYRIVDVI